MVENGKARLKTILDKMPLKHKGFWQPVLLLKYELLLSNSCFIQMLCLTGMSESGVP